EHFADPKNRVTCTSILVTPTPNRLQFECYGAIGDWSDVGHLIAKPTHAGVAWFPDANVAFLDATSTVWSALRLAALGQPNGSAVISGVAEYEMTEWLREPYRNRERAAAIRAALESETWVRSFRVASSNPLNKALYGYAHLLGFRRSL